MNTTDFFRKEQVYISRFPNNFALYLSLRFALFRKLTKSGGGSQKWFFGLVATIAPSLRFMIEMFRNRKKSAPMILVFSGPIFSSKTCFWDEKFLRFKSSWLGHEICTFDIKPPGFDRFLKKGNRYVGTLFPLELIMGLLFSPLTLLFSAKELVTIHRHFGVSFRWLVTKRIFCEGRRRFYQVILSIARPKQIFISDGYGKNLPIVIAGKNLGIETIEYQHGIISRTHTGYFNACLIDTPKCIPDKYLVWTGFERDLFLKYSPYSSIEVLEAANYSPRVWRFESNIFQTIKHLIVVMQPSIQTQLLDLCGKIESAGRKDIKLQIRLHPRQDRTRNLEVFPIENLNRESSSQSLYIGGFSTFLIDLALRDQPCIAINELVPDGYDDVLINYGVEVLNMNVVMEALK